MLIEFSAKNYRSIRDRQTLSMVAARAIKDLRDTNLCKAATVKADLLKSAALFGPNAAGKSNLLRAMLTLQTLVTQSAPASQRGESLPVSGFAFDTHYAALPSTFEILFEYQGVRYDYLCATTTQKVHHERMYVYPNSRRQLWFERKLADPSDLNGQSGEYIWEFGENFLARKDERAFSEVYRTTTRPNALFFSHAILLNNEKLRPAFDWIQRHLIVLTAGVSFNPFLSLGLLDEDHGRTSLLEYMQAADFDIDGLELVIEGKPDPRHTQVGVAGGVQLQIAVPALGKLEKVRGIAVWHSSGDSSSRVALDIGDESDGTRKFFELAGGWIRTFDIGATLLIDELDRSLHPKLTKFLVALFHNHLRHGQLIFTTHDTTLLDQSLMRRDQIWFIEKGPSLDTTLRPLLEYSPRISEQLQQGYLRGRYGAVPQTSELSAP
jgi:uncharacterized protein